MRDQILRHQLLLMRLVRTQARKTRAALKKAESIVLEAIKNNDYGNLRIKLTQTLGAIPAQAMVLISDLAIYEAEFNQKILKKELGIDVSVSPDAVINKLYTTPVATTVGGEKNTIRLTYQKFTDKKTLEILRTVSEARTLGKDSEFIQEKISSLTDGLFTAQNLALATIAISMTSNIIRSYVAGLAGLLVEWSVDLELNNCEYCLSKDGEIFEASEVEGEIPVHARCGCTLIPVER